VRRLLEIYAKDADTSRFERLYQVEVATGLIEADDLILYGIGKAFWSRGDTGKAKSYLSEIQAGSPFWFRARYFIGAMLVEGGDTSALEAAEPVFRELSVATPVAPEDRLVRDLALLALARIQFERGELEAAIITYQLVPDDSASRADKLHELAWTYIRLGRLKEAVTAVDAFLAAYPQHPFAAELNLVRGHLLFETGELVEAHAAYEKVVTEYAPVRDRFRRLARSDQKAETWVKQVMAMESTAAEPGGDEQLPGYAVALLQTDPDLSRAIGLFRELGAQDASLDASEALIQQISTAIGSSDSETDGARNLSMTAAAAMADGLTRYVDLLAVEAEWMRTAGGSEAAGLVGGLELALVEVRAGVDGLARAVEQARGDVAAERAADGVRATRAEAEARLAAARAELAALTAATQVPPTAAPPVSPEQRAEVEGRIAAAEQLLNTLPTAPVAGDAVARLSQRMRDAEGWEERLDKLSTDFRAARTRAGIDVEMDPTVARFDSAHRVLDTALDRLRRSQAMLSTGSDAHLYRVREVLGREADAVAEERGDLTESYTEAERVAGGIVRTNLERLAGRFGESVLGADMGVVNVFWSQLVDTADKVEAVKSERSAALQELERRYGYLESKAGGGAR
jgi:tetratricopeptide (TPR) repeat protein